MRNLSILLLFVFLAQKPAFSQDTISAQCFQQLLDVAINFKGHFMASQPLNNAHYLSDASSMNEFYWTMKDEKIPVDTSIIGEIIADNPNVDTSAWTDTEIRKYLLVKSDTISLDYVIKKLGLVNQSDINYYKELLRTINDPAVCEKEIYQFSRPLFDKTRHYAIVQYQQLDCRGSGKIQAMIFKYDNSSWTNLGAFGQWRADVLLHPKGLGH